MGLLPTFSLFSNYSCLFAVIIIIIIIVVVAVVVVVVAVVVSLMVIIWSLSGNKSPRVIRTLLCILVDLSNVVVGMLSTPPVISESSSL